MQKLEKENPCFARASGEKINVFRISEKAGPLMAKKGLRLTLSSDTATFRHFWENELKKDTLRKKLFNNKTAELERGKQQKKREASYFPNKKHFSDHNQLFIEKWPYFSDRYFSIEIHPT